MRAEGAVALCTAVMSYNMLNHSGNCSYKITLKISVGFVKYVNITKEEIQTSILTAFCPRIFSLLKISPAHIAPSCRLFRWCGRRSGRNNRNVPVKRAPNEHTRRTAALMVFEWIVFFRVAFLRSTKCTTNYITQVCYKNSTAARLLLSMKATYHLSNFWRRSASLFIFKCCRSLPIDCCFGGGLGGI